MMNPTNPGPDGFDFPESYPTFWEAIPIDTDIVAQPPIVVTAQSDDAYSAFISQADDAGAFTLQVEQTDVG